MGVGSHRYSVEGLQAPAPTAEIMHAGIRDPRLLKGATCSILTRSGTNAGSDFHAAA